MKCLVVIALIIVSSEAFLKSGTLNLSGSFQAHPLFANHPLLAKHRLFGGSQSKPVESVPPADPVVVETTESTVPVQSDTSSPSNSIHSFHKNIDIQKILNDLVGVKEILLKHIQQGINDRFDNKLRRLEKFETHLQNHFNKNSATATTPKTNVGLDATISTPDNGLAFDATVSVNKDSKFAPEINVITNESATTDTHDFDLADSSLNDYKSANLSGREPIVSNCDH